MAMQSKAWMTTFLLKEFLSFFKRFITNGISITNRHPLILDGHGSHVTLEAIEQVQEFGLDMITLPLHTSHEL
jgi:dissimilatory sulfite reductase (desulfoviridin) alpha/beta subunit